MDLDRLLAPNPNDVICGRGKGFYTHEGNFIFQDLIEKHKNEYSISQKSEKSRISKNIVKAIQSQHQPGRFIEYNSLSGTWIEIDDRRALDKTGQALRERRSIIKPTKKFTQSDIKIAAHLDYCDDVQKKAFNSNFCTTSSSSNTVESDFSETNANLSMTSNTLKLDFSNKNTTSINNNMKCDMSATSKTSSSNYAQSAFPEITPDRITSIFHPPNYHDIIPSKKTENKKHKPNKQISLMSDKSICSLHSIGPRDFNHINFLKSSQSSKVENNYKIVNNDIQPNLCISNSITGPQQSHIIKPNKSYAPEPPTNNKKYKADKQLSLKSEKNACSPLSIRPKSRMMAKENFNQSNSLKSSQTSVMQNSSEIMNNAMQPNLCISNSSTRPQQSHVINSKKSYAQDPLWLRMPSRKNQEQIVGNNEDSQFHKALRKFRKKHKTKTSDGEKTTSTSDNSILDVALFSISCDKQQCATKKTPKINSNSCSRVSMNSTGNENHTVVTEARRKISLPSIPKMSFGTSFE